MIWRKVLDGRYEVSNSGLIRTTRNGKLLSLRQSIDGYIRIGATYRGKRRTVYIHRLVAEAFIRKPRKDETVNHKDHDKSNNKPSNLEYMSRRDNALYTVRLNRHLKGEAVGNSKLTEAQVRQIKKFLNLMTRTELGKAFGVNHKAISGIANGKTWRHV